LQSAEAISMNWIHQYETKKKKAHAVDTNIERKDEKKNFTCRPVRDRMCQALYQASCTSLSRTPWSAKDAQHLFSDFLVTITASKHAPYSFSVTSSNNIHPTLKPNW
jgi:hypothetical protein